MPPSQSASVYRQRFRGMPRLLSSRTYKHSRFCCLRLGPQLTYHYVKDVKPSGYLSGKSTQN